MKKNILLLVGIIIAICSQAQSLNPTTKKPVKDWSKIDLSSRPADHFMIQFGSDSWFNRPDSVRTKGFSRHFNMYFMLDKPFKANPKFSAGIGVGLGTSNMFFEHTYVNLKSNSAKLPFTNVDSTEHFNKFKVVTFYVEAPIEIRYFSDPEHPGKSWKAALGVKVGTLIKSYSKAKNLETKNGVSIYGTNYVQKEVAKRFMNSTTLQLTGRIGYGIASIDVGYGLLGVLKDGTGPTMNRFSVGLTISGL